MGFTQNKGLGDTVETITTTLGIRKVVDTISGFTGADCGCEKRKKWLNEKGPYKK